VPNLVFLGLSVLEIGPMYATDRETDVRQKHHLMRPPYGEKAYKNPHGVNGLANYLTKMI